MGIDIDQTIITNKSKSYAFSNKFFPIKVSYKKLKYEIVDKSKVNKSNLILRLVLKLLNLDDVKHYSEIADSCSIIRQLYNEGNEIFLISSRPNWHGLTNAVLTWCEQNNLSFTHLVVNCNDKIKFCNEYDIDVLVDNSLRICKYANKSDIDSICLKNAKKHKSHDNIFFAVNWQTIYEHIKDNLFDIKPL